MPEFEALQAGDPERIGGYRIVTRLGAGGMGRVYLGRSRSGRAVAVKIIRPELSDDPGFRKRFAREVAHARTVSGFFTAGVVDADPAASPPWLATAYIPGMSLDEAVSEYGPWDEAYVLALATGLAEALGSIHAAGVVHRDLKPSNVLLADDGPRVIDFGISLATEGSRMTGTGLALGTPGFVSPEQLTGASVGPAGDVFCLGSVLAFAATGTGPFGGGSWQGQWYRTVHEEPDLTSVPPRLRALIARCLAKQPEERPTVTALLDEVAANITVDGRFTDSTWLPAAVAEGVRTRVSRPLPVTAPDVPAAPRTLVDREPAEPRTRSAPEPPPTDADANPPPYREPATLREHHGPGSAADPPTAVAAPRTLVDREPAEPRTRSAPEPPPTDADANPPHRERAAIRVYHGSGSAAAFVVDAPAPELARGYSRRRILLGLTGVATAGLLGSLLRINDAPGTVRGRPTSTFGPSPGPRPSVPGLKWWSVSAVGPVDGPPVVRDGVVYVISRFGTVSAVDAATGHVRWDLKVAQSPTHSSPVVVDGVLYTGSGNELYAVDTATGRERWSFATGGTVFSTPAVAEGTVYVSGNNGKLYAVDTATGGERWSRTVGRGDLRSSPAVAGGIVYIGGDDGKLYALDTVGGSERWSFAQGIVESAPALINGVLYGVSVPKFAVEVIRSGTMSALDPATGREQWSFKTQGSSTPTAAQGVLFFTSGSGLHALDIDRRSARWHFSFDGGFVSTPVLNGGAVYVGAGSGLYAVNAADGRRRWRFDVHHEQVVSKPAVFDGVAYFGVASLNRADDGLYAVKV
ncbi:PQQ-binding-like beta-propeller repeat protein [Rhizohabitans arisaemae]|uniref:outer membrane protein assembly factor BamB family protein n=1 Tax=Rhizohabitans arisaemae TaxID=2720610 RepID=UPI0024B26DEE|nr:PQQ-binding-like beta-propeller repeat protein [Rhizohabitans arisaemae]